MVGVDIHSNPGSLTVQQKLTKLSTNSDVTELCRTTLAVSDGSQLFFSYSSGKIWRLSGGVFTLVYTTSPSSGNAGALGAEEFNGNVYWATQNFLHYVPTADIGTAALWTANAVPNHKTFANGNASYHPMVVQNDQLFVGDGYVVGSLSTGDTFTGNALTLEQPHVVKTMIDYDIDILVGTIISTSVNYSKIYRWDTVQATWQYGEPVEECGVNCLFRMGKVIFANCGQAGNIYQYTGTYLDFYKKIPGMWNPSNQAEVYPGAWDNWNGRVLLGLSQTTGDPCDQAVYQFGAYDPKYPIALTEDFPISTGSFTGVQVGSVLVSGTNVYVTWADSNSSTNGVDQVDYSNKYASAFVESTRVNATGIFEKGYWRAFANFQSMPANCSLNFGYYADTATTVTYYTNTIYNDTLNVCQAFVEEEFDARAVRLRMEFTVSGNTAPIIEAIGISPTAL